MSASPFSIRLDDTLRDRLEEHAARVNRPAGFVVQQALDSYLSAHERFLRDIDAAFKEADKGVFISQEAMHRWMESWDTNNELPPPEPDIFPDGYKK
jgi:predicted transcriptional regulator